MNNIEQPPSFAVRSRQIIHLAVQLLALAFLLIWCFQILAPFFTPIVWAAILAVTLFPLHQKIKRWLKGRSVLAAILITVAFLTIFISLISWLSITTGIELKEQVASIQQGNLKIPPPSENVKNWPLVGRKTFQAWT